MECLADTGSNMYLIGGVAALLLCAALALIFKKKIAHARRRFFPIIFIAAALIFSASPLPLYAASSANPECPPPAANTVSGKEPVSVTDSSSGRQGQPQTYNVLQNDTPGEGQSFVLSSLRLALIDNPVPGSTLSDDQKTVVVPGEGTYVANGDGTITFTPYAMFTGAARGVRYSIANSAGKITRALFTPYVTPAEAVAMCSEPGLANMKLQSVGYSEYGSNKILGSVQTQPLAAMSANGDKVAAITKSGMMYVSSDKGESWRSTAAGQHRWNAVAVSQTGSHIIGVYVENSGFSATSYAVVSSDGGVNWRTHKIKDGYITVQGMSISTDGKKISLLNGDGGRTLFYSIDSGVTWNSTDLNNSGFVPNSIRSSADGNVVFALHNHMGTLLRVTEDFGITWRDITLAPATTSVQQFSVSPDGRRVTVVDDTKALYISDDGGITWQTKGGFTTLPGEVVSYQVADQGTHVSSIISTPGNYQMFTSNNLGASWTARPAIDYAAAEIGYMLYSDDATKFIHVSGSGAVKYSHDDGATIGQSQIPWLDLTQYIDLDPSTPGIQTSVKKVVTTPRGEFELRATYDPTTDTLSFTAPRDSFLSINDMDLTYTITKDDCQQPQPGVIYLIQEA